MNNIHILFRISTFLDVDTFENLLMVNKFTKNLRHDDTELILTRDSNTETLKMYPHLKKLVCKSDTLLSKLYSKPKYFRNLTDLDISGYPFILCNEIRMSNFTPLKI